jgi:glyoxylase-like metal-dependent hydrolase (beta-lactamase superfamily II)
MISHAHPDHFMGLEVITNRFPQAQVMSTANVVGDIQQDGPWMFSLLQSKLGAAGPTRLMVPQVLPEPKLSIEGSALEVMEFGEAESKHTAAVYIPGLKALFSADLVYNQAHLYLQERHLQSWLKRLDELEAFANNKDKIARIYPGHGSAAGPWPMSCRISKYEAIASPRPATIRNHKPTFPALVRISTHIATTSAHEPMPQDKNISDSTQA